MLNVQRKRQGFRSSIWIAAALVFCACGESGVDPNFQMLPSPVYADAQVVADAGALPPVASGDSGIIAQSVDAQAPFDATQPQDGQAVPDALPPRIGDGGPLADTGAGEAGTADAAPPHMDLGKGTGTDVLTIGDSWMLLLFTGIQESLVTASGNQPYRLYAFPGTRMLSGEIPDQYASAKREDPNIKTVVMTGGGNDIIQDMAIQDDCTTGGALCKEQLDKIGKALTDLWAQMSKDGVQDVVHVMYSSSAGDPIKDREANNKALADLCAAVPPPLRCHLLNTDMLILKEDIRSDGIHPTDSGYDKIGKAVFDLMVKEGMRR